MADSRETKTRETKTRETKTRETKTRDVRTRPKPIMSKKTPHAGLEPATLSLEG